MNWFRNIANEAEVNTARRLPVRAAVAFACAATVLPMVRAALAVEPLTPLANLGRQAWVMENGLPQNTVQALVQTKDGFVWLGTEAGLVRFDGISFQVFDRSSTPALPGNDVCCLLEAKDGGIVGGEQRRAGALEGW